MGADVRDLVVVARHHDMAARLRGRDGARSGSRGVAVGSGARASSRGGRHARFVSLRPDQNAVGSGVDRRSGAPAVEPLERVVSDADYRRICIPSSTTRFGGIRKKSLKRTALRAITPNSFLRQTAIPPRSEGISVSRPRKNVVFIRSRLSPLSRRASITSAARGSWVKQ